MTSLSGKYLRSLIAGTNLFAFVLGAGVHFHLPVAHEHEGRSTHRHIFAVHYHADIPYAQVEPSRQQSDSGHRHHVPLVQIVAVHPVSIQTGSHPVEQHESIALPRMAPAPDLEPFGLINFTDTSPPFEQRITKHTTGRAPPLA